MIALTENDKKQYANIWVVAEQLSGEIQLVTHELIGAARPLADARGSQVWVVATGKGISKKAESLYAYGADKVIVVDDPRLNDFNDELEARILGRLIKKYKPE
ncbi:MAG: electron transfer flavoprotein subunit alpha/FixB family protein, partial [Clostridia bacterium]|nr:electron transfer flavoprotein subunit alpha/FixB family protein [Clostridia bacterium]